MMETQNYWEDSSAHSMQVKYEGLDARSCKDEIYRMGIGKGYCEGNLNFATASEDDEAYTKKKVSRQDPMSHRIIEKRRRDRMNNCLADLSRLIPAEYLKKGRGRVEKTEIIEMAIRHMKHLQGLRQDNKHSGVTTVHPEDSVDSVPHAPAATASTATEHYRLGFQECLSETMHFLIEVEGFFARDSLCVQLINHLQQHCEKILATSDRLGFPHPEMPTTNGTTNGNIYNHHHQNHHHMNMPPQCQPTTNGHFDHGSSSSGVSSLGDREHPLRSTLIPPPMLVSDDSNHSTHSHSNPPMMMMLTSLPSSMASTNTPPAPTSTICNQNNNNNNNNNYNIENNNTTVNGNDCRPTNYKFKSSIKQRFSAERIKSSPPPMMNLHEKPSPTHGVPIFALHDAGTFYVPLTVEASLLRPHLNFIPDAGPDTVLHPIKISVNFNHTSSHAGTWLTHDQPQNSPLHLQPQD